MKNLTLAFAVASALLSFGCKEKKGDNAGAAMVKLSELKDEMCTCKDAKCAQDVSDKMAKWTQEMSKGGEPPKMSEADQKKAATLGEDLAKCMQTAMATGAAPAAPEAPAVPAEGSAQATAPLPGDLPPECSEYKAAIDKLSTCTQMPQGARDVLKKAFEDAAAGWAKLPTDAKASLKSPCKAGADAVISTAKDQCGW